MTSQNIWAIGAGDRKRFQKEEGKETIYPVKFTDEFIVQQQGPSRRKIASEIVVLCFGFIFSLSLKRFSSLFSIVLK